ncbi:MAG TPA: MlaD family protein [Thermoanaerobaculia bacterium]|nr:MlaD family protein [Thermoanaerobaculia bacterium]
MSSAAKVGAFMLVVLGVLAFFVLKIEDVKVRRTNDSKKITAVFDSVAGLDNRSAVRVAGVRVGKVTKIDLRPDGKAEVELEIDKDVQLHANAQAHVANLGLLGEKYIELDPGTPNQPVLSEQKTVVLPGTQPATIDQVTDQISAIATDVKAITASLRATVATPNGQAQLQDIVANVDNITKQVRDLIAANRANVDATMANAQAITAQLKTQIPRLADSIERVANSMNGTLNENRADVHKAIENLKTLSADLRTTSENLGAITGQVRSGKGTVGKLLYEDETANRLNSALASVESGVNELRNTIGRVGKLQLDLGMNADYYAGLPKQQAGLESLSGNSRSAIWLRLSPNPTENNRFYNVELADTPNGHQKDKIFETTTLDPATGTSSTTITKETQFDRNFVISAQAGWHLGAVDARVGLIDSTGGGGVDLHWNRRLTLTGEAFDFSERYDKNPHLRLFGEYTLRQAKPKTPLIFIRSGIDNPFNNTAFIVGAGIRWRDDDLKYLLGSVPIPK